jgi:hypothetical protein
VNYEVAKRIAVDQLSSVQRELLTMVSDGELTPEVERLAMAMVQLSNVVESLAKLTLGEVSGRQ